MPPVRKYRNIKTEIDGITFDSKAEAMRWQELRLLERAGEIGELKRQVPFDLRHNGVKITTYRADFVYHDKRLCKTIIEDVKSKATKTAAYRIKAKLMAAQGTPITEVMR